MAPVPGSLVRLGAVGLDAVPDLPLDPEIAVGHRAGDDAGLVRRPVQVRTDSAGCTGFVWHAGSRNVGFAVIARSNAGVHAAISRIAFDGDSWQSALGQDGEERSGAAAAEVTEYLDLSAWPSGTRLIVRCEPLHPGAQHSLFPLTIFCYWRHYTDAAGDPVDLDMHMWAHARVEDNIRRLKDSGRSASPSPTSRPTACGWPSSASQTTSCAGSRSSASPGPWPSPSPRR